MNISAAKRMPLDGVLLWQHSSRKAPFGCNRPAERRRRLVGQFEFPLFMHCCRPRRRIGMAETLHHKARYPEIPWADIAGAGNVYRHDYEDVRQRAVWNTVQKHLPLLAAVEQELRQLGELP